MYIHTFYIRLSPSFHNTLKAYSQQVQLRRVTLLTLAGEGATSILADILGQLNVIFGHDRASFVHSGLVLPRSQKTHLTNTPNSFVGIGLYSWSQLYHQPYHRPKASIINLCHFNQLSVAQTKPSHVSPSSTTSPRSIPIRSIGLQDFSV